MIGWHERATKSLMEMAERALDQAIGLGLAVLVFGGVGFWICSAASLLNSKPVTPDFHSGLRQIVRSCMSQERPHQERRCVELLNVWEQCRNDEDRSLASALAPCDPDEIFKFLVERDLDTADIRVETAPQ